MEKIVGRKRKKKNRKKRYIPPERYIKRNVRLAVIKRDGNRCVYCHRKKRRKYPLLKEIKMEFGHVIPHSKGGDKCINNIQLECFECNREKGATRRERSLLKQLMGAGAKGCKRHE